MKTQLTLAAAAVALSLTAGASAQAIYSDSFNRTVGQGDPTGGTGDSDFGVNDNALGGVVAAEYLVGPERGGGANQVVDQVGFTIEGGALLPIDASALASAGFTVSFQFDRFAGPSEGGDGNGFIAIGLGADTSLDASAIGARLFAVNNSDTSILFQQSTDGSGSGNAQVYVNDENATTGASFPNAFNYGDPLATHQVTLTVTPQMLGMYGTADQIDVRHRRRRQRRLQLHDERRRRLRHVRRQQQRLRVPLDRQPARERGPRSPSRRASRCWARPGWGWSAAAGDCYPRNAAAGRLARPRRFSFAFSLSPHPPDPPRMRSPMFP